MVEPIRLFNLNGKLVLGSKSPRRNELLRILNIPFSVRASEVDEIAPSNLNDIDTVSWVARQKSDALLSSIKSGEILLTADTEVWMDEKRFGKPKGIDKCIKMLLKLNGREHRVISSVWATDGKIWKNSSQVTLVKFEKLPKTWIKWYAQNYKPFDKAGGYGVQEWIGHIGIKQIEGSYDNVKGLPLNSVLEVLKPWLRS
jgi:septum formation protein